MRVPVVAVVRENCAVGVVVALALALAVVIEDLEEDLEVVAVLRVEDKASVETVLWGVRRRTRLAAIQRE